MIHFDGETRFNGKAVRASYNQGWDTPGEWGVSFDDGRYFVVDEARALKPKNQLDFLRYVLRDGAEAPYVTKYIQDLFDANWDVVGSSEDVIRISLQHVGYNSSNAAEDVKTVKKIRSKLSSQFSELGDFFIGEELPSEADARLFVSELAAYQKLVEQEMKEVSVSQARLDVFAKLQAGEPVGVGWTNETFWNDFKHTDSGRQVAAILMNK